ncbi:MAG: beta-lactamase induction signal transducer [Rhodobacterales bacterium CG15_BIG_FIL_POST_REV_8_21_14_020_59_13]|nr:MAG: beta-lactamase induction signal transducer [Rhodobacterales bacterium CG15_BIG_FIL_POST_REV_8_21_14_020_59_13]
MAEASASKRTAVSLLGNIGRDRSLLAMLLLGLGAGLPYAILTGTLNAWFTENDVDVSTIGVLSWIGLAYAFKFLWSPALHRSSVPVLGRLGSRRGWMLVFQTIIMISMATIAFASPQNQLALITLMAFLGVVASASQDIVIDAWRIEVARDDRHLNSLSAIYQLGYRVAGFLGGFLALILAARIGWSFTFILLTLMMLLAVGGVLIAQESKITAQDEPGVQLGAGLPTRTRRGALLIVVAGWGWALVSLGGFMYATVTADTPPNARDFIRYTGPWIVFFTVILPAIISAILLWLEARSAAPVNIDSSALGRGADTLHRFILEPLMDIVSRLGWAAPLVLLLILSYRFTDLVWGAFAYPFYLGTNYGAMAYSLDDVAIASKFVGVIMVIAGVGLGGLALKAFGRMPCLIAGAVMAAATNLLFWDLTTGAAYVGGFLEFTQLYNLFALFGIGERLAWLVTAIAGENLAVGFASVVFVAYLSAIVNPKYAAVQYALLASLTMLVGTLGRGALGEIVETNGFAYVFILTALLGLVAVAASIAEAIRARFAPKKATAAEDPPPGIA